MAKMKIKKGDLVQVISGRSQKNGGDRGKQGKVIAVYPDTQRVLVEGVNRVTRHTKVGTDRSRRPTGGIITPGGRRPRQQRGRGGPGDQEARPASGSGSTWSSATDARRPCVPASPCVPVRTSDD